MLWRVADVMTGRLLGTLPVHDYSVSDPVVGSGGGTVQVGLRGVDRDAVALIRGITTPDVCALVLDDESGSADPYLWTGPIIGRTWKRRAGALEVGTADWRSWFYTSVLRPGAPATNSVGDYLAVGVEQATILAQIALQALGDPAAPAIDVEVPVATGTTRDVTLRRWKNLGEALDQVAGREDGMEWWVDAVPATDPRFVQWRWRAAPQRSQRIDSPVYLASNKNGGNITDYDWPESSVDRRSRVTALGEGSPPDVLYATDEDPDIGDGTSMLREQVSGPYSGVINAATLFDNAAAERTARNVAVQSIVLTVRGNDPDLSSYTSGDRARVSIHDEWLDLEYPAVRIIDRTISGGRGKALTASLTVDLNDADVPDASAGDQVDL